jgi:hypothetical protein
MGTLVPRLLLGSLDCIPLVYRRLTQNGSKKVHLYHECSGIYDKRSAAIFYVYDLYWYIYANIVKQ